MREYQLIRSKRRTLALELRPGGEVVVRAPRLLPRSVIDRFVSEREEWITKKLATLPPPRPEIAPEQLDVWRREAAAYLPARVAHYAALMGLIPAAVKITAARTRWGSCSAKGNLNFSCRLMGQPPEAIDYVVVHELCHLRHMNHSADFWRLVASVLPDYKERAALLKQ
jgi:predicted metal-dependent hydrolase